MKKIQMVDLKSQYNLIKEEVNKSVIDVIESGMFINGPTVKDFSKNLEKYLNVNNVIPCANGTDALQVALMALELKPGDEVITVDFTFASTVEVIALLGLVPILVDIDEETFNIDVTKIEQFISKKTKAIIPVHLFGQSCDMDAIMAIANKYNLFVIEDNAQAIGCNYKDLNGNKFKTGTIGHIGTTSFFPSKNLGCYGDGGAIFTNNDKYAEIIRGLVNHGMYKRYYHDLVGINSRLDSVQAAILDIKLKYIDEYNSKRRKSAIIYNKMINCKGLIKPIIKNDDDSHVFHQYTLRILDNKRDSLVEFLNKNDIPCGIYYPVPLHKQKAYTNQKNKEEDFSVTNKLSKEVISLPMHSELSNEQISFIAGKINDFLA
tara:strand:+ start:88 stop:1215 length:1128 start_codon:yes stop_codon:yes gene_type:complete